MCQSSYNTLGDFHHVCFEVRNDKRGRGRISVRFLFPFLRGLASSVLVSPKNGKTCTARPHFFYFFLFFNNIHSGVYTGHTDCSNYPCTYLPPFFFHSLAGIGSQNPLNALGVISAQHTRLRRFFFSGVRLLQAPLFC